MLLFFKTSLFLFSPFLFNNFLPPFAPRILGHRHSFPCRSVHQRILPSLPHLLCLSLRIIDFPATSLLLLPTFPQMSVINLHRGADGSPCRMHIAAEWQSTADVHCFSLKNNAELLMHPLHLVTRVHILSFANLKVHVKTLGAFFGVIWQPSVESGGQKLAARMVQSQVIFLYVEVWWKEMQVLPNTGKHPVFRSSKLVF